MSPLRTTRPVPLVALLLTSSLALAADPASIVQRAIDAHGGRAALRSQDDASYSGTVVRFFGSSESTGTFEIDVRGGRMVRQGRVLTFRGRPFESASASTGERAWRRFRSRVYDYPVDDFDTWLAHRPTLLLAAADAPDRLSLVGEGAVDGDPCTLVDFDSERGSVRVAIDASHGLLRSLEYKAMENAGEGKKEEVFLKKTFSDYRPIDGIPFPHAMTEHRDGVPQMELTVESARLGSPPDLARFARPEEDEEAQQWGDQLAD